MRSTSVSPYRSYSTQGTMTAASHQPAIGGLPGGTGTGVITGMAG